MSAYTLSPQMRTNFRYLYLDVLWIGLLYGATLAFQGVYAARLGASSLELGLLSAGPAIAGLFYTLPAGRVLENRPLLRVTFLAGLIQRLALLSLAALPWLLGNQAQIWGLILITLAVSLPGTLLGIGFNALFAEVVPDAWRGEVVSKRNALIAVSMTVTVLVCGQILDRIIFPLNYQIVFVMGGLGALVSTYCIGKIASSREEAPLAAGWRVFCGGRGGSPSPQRGGGLRSLIFPPSSEGKPLLRLDVLRGPFGRFMGAYLVFYTCQNLVIPLFPLFYVNELGLSDSAISLGSAVFYTAMMLTSLLAVKRLGQRFSNRGLLVGGGLAFAFYPLMLAVSRGPALFWVASVWGGIVWAILNVGLINRLMERVPEDDRPAHMAIHNLALNIGLLAGSLLGSLVDDGLGLRNAMYLGAALRFAAGLLLWWVK